jgi:hypothetical protein
MNGNSVFGIPTPVNGQKYSSATWFGTKDNNWFDTENWSQDFIPHGNVSTLIKPGANQPVIGDGGTNASAAVLELESGTSLTINSGKNLDVGFYGIFSGGNMTSNGNVTFGTDLDVKAGSTLDIEGGTFTIGP